MIRKLLIGVGGLFALFAVAGSALFFTQPTAAQTRSEVAAGVNLFGDRAGQFGERSDGRFAAHHDDSAKLERLAQHLGMTVDALQAELDAGKTVLEIAEEQGVEIPERGRRGGNRFAGKIDRQAVVADVLGITVEELQAAREAGTTLAELAEANGTTLDAVKDAIEAATIEAINQALADGEITQEQADMLLEKIALKSLALEIFNKEDAQAIVAELLGVTVEELDAAREAGTTLEELATANDTTVEAVKEAVMAAREAAIQTAIENGTLTAEQGEQLLNGRGGFGGGRGHHGHGHNRSGGRGGFGPANFAPPVQADA